MGPTKTKTKTKFLDGDDKPDTHPVNVTGCTAPQCVDKVSKPAGIT